MIEVAEDGPTATGVWRSPCPEPFETWDDPLWSTVERTPAERSCGRWKQPWPCPTKGLGRAAIW
jgi:hypothetical protein